MRSLSSLEMLEELSAFTKNRTKTQFMMNWLVYRTDLGYGKLSVYLQLTQTRAFVKLRCVLRLHRLPR